MALDPTIALHQGPQVQFDPAVAASKGLNLRVLAMQPDVVMQQLANARATESATRAATAATVQKTEEEARQLSGSKAFAELGKKHVKVLPNGKTEVNKEALLHDAMVSGIPTEQLGKLMGDVYAIRQSQFKDAETSQKAIDNTLFEFDHLLRVQKDAGVGAQQVKHMEEELAKRVGPERARAAVSARYGDDPTAFIQRAGINAAGTISPQQAEQFKLDKERIAQAWGTLSVAQQGLIQSGAANLTSPEALDKNSDVSKAYRAMAIAAGRPENEVRNLSAAQIHRIQGMQDAIASGIPSAGVRAELGVGAAGTEAVKGVVDQAIPVLQSMKDQYGRAGSITRSAWNKMVQQDPKFGAVQSAIDEYNTRNPNSKLDILDGFDTIQRRLGIESRKLGGVAEKQRAVGGSTNLVETVGGKPAAAPAGAKSVQMMAPNGTMYSIPADQVEAMKARGLKVK